MLKVQEYLQKNSLEQLKKEYAIEVTHSPIGEPLVILNYCQIDSPKYSPITRECRGLVLDTTDWSVVAKPFNRFFNYGENREEINKFDWNNFSVHDKEDGSLIILYHYRGSWRVNTRGSFGLGKVGISQHSWEELFHLTIDDKDLDYLDTNYTFVFELCSIHNKVVRTYSEPQSFLLAIFDNRTCEEVKQERVAQFKITLGWQVPSLRTFSSVDEIISYLEGSEAHPTFEGFVIRDVNGNRIKIKNKNYLRLHRMRGNGDNLFAPKNLVPFILTGETDELLAIYPEVANHVDSYARILGENLVEIHSVYSQIWNRNTQKSYALKVQELCPKWSAIFFQLRKKDPQSWEEAATNLTKIFRESSEYITKVLDSELKASYTETSPLTTT